MKIVFITFFITRSKLRVHEIFDITPAVVIFKKIYNTELFMNKPYNCVS
jgi:hypothetical protein